MTTSMNHHKPQSSFSLSYWLYEAVPRSIVQANIQKIYHSVIKFFHNFSAVFGLIIIFVII